MLEPINKGAAMITHIENIVRDCIGVNDAAVPGVEPRSISWREGKKKVKFQILNPNPCTYLDHSIVQDLLQIKKVK